MKTLVVDASAAASWLLASQSTAPARRLLAALDDYELIAPDVFQWEIGNLLVRQSRRDAGFDLYDNFFEAKVLVGERDTTLDRASMVASAEQGRERNSGVAIIETSGTNHFICLERPEVVRGVAEQTAEMVT